MRLFCLILISWCFQHAASARCNTLLDSYSKCQVEEKRIKRSLENTRPTVMFEASGANTETGDWNLQNVVLDDGDGYNKSNGVFTAPASGIYLMSFTTIPFCAHFEENKTSTCSLSFLDQSFEEQLNQIIVADNDIMEIELKFDHGQPENIVVTIPIVLIKGKAVAIRRCSEPYSYASWRGFLMQETI